MYHYLKWAAVSLFFRRNLRYLVLIAVGFVGIYVTDAVYEDMADFAAKSGQTGAIGTYLLIKWAAVLAFGALILFSIMRLGFSGGKRGRKKEPKERAPKKPKPAEIPDDDPIMKRLERFKNPEPLRRKSDMVIEKRRRRG